jgi:L,D-peptidoglycan transpeptidase YkuD (ErfK/YbiS/YcfS/YnhG family)
VPVAKLIPSLLLLALAVSPLTAVAARVVASEAPSCTPGLAGELASTAKAEQLVTVAAPSTASTSGSLELWTREGRCWRLSAGPWVAELGRAGLALHRREGDGTTPEGAFGIGRVMYGVAPDPGVHYRYHRLVCGDWWNEDPTSAGYNTFAQLACGARPAFGGDSEPLWRSPEAYAYLALIDYNTAPVVPGAGSAIFLHVSFGGPTDGCVALPRGELVTVLRWLRPTRAPLIVIGSMNEITRF